MCKISGAYPPPVRNRYISRLVFVLAGWEGAEPSSVVYMLVRGVLAVSVLVSRRLPGSCIGKQAAVDAKRQESVGFS